MDPSEAREAAEQREMEEEKKAATATVRPVSQSESDEESGNPADPGWAPGFWNRFPWLGFGALFIVLLTSGASILILLLSNHRSETHWIKQLPPNVLLGQMNNVANICFGIAIGNGIAISWWRKTLQGATIKELHRSWAFSDSVKSLALAGKYFNFIALAALTTKLTIIDSSLMQKAFSTYNAEDAAILLRGKHGVRMFANETIPYTGNMNFEGIQSMLPWFVTDLRTLANSDGLLQSAFEFEQCDGLCSFNVSGAGLEFDCDKPTTKAINYGMSTVHALEYYEGNKTTNASEKVLGALFAASYAPVFNITFGMGYDALPGQAGNASSDVDLNNEYTVTGNYTEHITMDLLYTWASDLVDPETSAYSCPGTRAKLHCRLRPAVVKYPVQIQNYSQTHAVTGVSIGLSDIQVEGLLGNEPDAFANPFGVLNRSVNQEVGGFGVIRREDIIKDVDQQTYQNTRLGGILLGLQQYMTGEAWVNYGASHGGFDLNMTGTASQYMLNPLLLNSTQCSYEMSDPVLPWTGSGLRSIVQQINEIMFSIAIDLTGGDPDRTDYAMNTYDTLVVRDTIHYRTNIWYMIGAVISTFICVLCVLPSYWGFWQLGRKVALSPFEIAAAFRSPMVDHSGTIDDVIKERGHQVVRYGHITTGDAAGRLGIAEPEYVERAHPKIGSARQEINEKFTGVFGRSPTR